jgi:hypothetical protein
VIGALTISDLSRWSPCAPAREWARAQPDQSLAALWRTCPDGTWSLWLCARAGVDTRAIGYWCAERARQTAIRALTAAGVDCARLRGCAPIVDRETASAASSAASEASWAASEASWAASWAAAAAAEAEARAAARASAAASWAAAEAAAAEAAAAEAAAEAEAAAAEAAEAAEAAARAAARAAEIQTIADHVRETVPWAEVEAGLRLALRGGQ